MAKIFNSYFMQKEFEQLYRVLLPSLNECGACGIVKCYLCKKFDVTCSPCKFRRCAPCVKFFNTLNFFYKNSSREQWNYVCNFLHDLFRLHYRTKEFFKDVSVPIRSSIRHSCFIVSSDEKKTIMTSDKKKKIFYMLGNRKYKFYYDPI